MRERPWPSVDQGQPIFKAVTNKTVPEDEKILSCLQGALLYF